MALKYSNNASSRVAVAFNIGALSLTIDDATGFPVLGTNDTCRITLENDDGDIEICEVTNITGNTLTISATGRAIEPVNGAQVEYNWIIGDRVEVRTTAGGLNEVQQNAASAHQYSTPILITNTSSAANVYEGTLNPTISAYSLGLRVILAATHTNTGGSTLNLDGLGAANIIYAGGNTLDAGAIVAGSPVMLIYDGANFVLQGTAVDSHDVGYQGTGNGFDADMLDGAHRVAFGELALPNVWTDDQTISATDAILRLKAGSVGADTAKTLIVDSADVNVAELSVNSTQDVLTVAKYNAAGSAVVSKIELHESGQVVITSTNNSDIDLVTSGTGTLQLNGVDVDSEDAVLAGTQTVWNNVIGSRSNGTTKNQHIYPNNHTYPIMVNISLFLADYGSYEVWVGSGATPDIRVGHGSLVDDGGGSGHSTTTVSFIVPAGHTYSCNTSLGSVQVWAELY